MSLPDNFSPFEHLQSVFSLVHNRIVREEFRDVGDDDWDPEITTPRGSLRVACTIVDNDSATMMLIRMWLFYILLRKASDLHPAIYSTPIDRYQQEVKFLPQILLYFREDLDDVEAGYSPLDAEISFRIAGENSNTITEGEVQNLANRIRSEFASADGYRWRKGRVVVRYKKQSAGYQLRVNAYSEAEGREVISKVLDLQNDVIDRELLTVTELLETPPIVPPSTSILGRSRRLPRKLPVGWVRFQWAELHVWGLPNPIVLVDRSNRRRSAIIVLP